MSALWIELDTAPLEAARGDAVFVLVFQNERPLRGNAGRADWRLCGCLSALLARKRLSGARGEAALIPTAGGLRAPMLVALGAGAREAFDEEVWGRIAGEVARRSLLLRARSAVLPLPPADERLGLRPRLERLVAAAAGALGEHPADDLLLRVVVSREELLRATELLRSYRPRGLPESVALRLSPGPDRHLDREGARPSI